MASLERSVSMATKVTREEADEIRKAADEEGLTVSEYLRAATLMYQALSLRPYAVRVLMRGGLRAGARVAALALSWVRQEGAEQEATRATRR